MRGKVKVTSKSIYLPITVYACAKVAKTHGEKQWRRYIDCATIIFACDSKTFIAAFDRMHSWEMNRLARGGR